MDYRRWLTANIYVISPVSTYESEDYQYIFGINGAGYDFYEQHWIPLYDARGLHWHVDIRESSTDD